MFSKALLFGVAAVLAGTSSASATYNYYIDVLADAGTYSPIALGGDLEVDACGSTVHHASRIQHNRPDLFSFGLCDMPDLTEFSLTWTAQLGNSYTTLGTFSGANAAAGLNATFTTGTGTFFSGVGTYIVSLYLDMPNNYANIPLPNGYIGRPGSDSGFDPNNPGHGHGWRNADLAQTSFSLTSAPVAEPLGALLLIPGLVFIMRRQNKRRKQT